MRINKWIPLFGLNFSGVFNDNILKTLIGFVCVIWIGADSKATLVASASALLVLPYVFLSPLASRAAHSFSQLKIIRYAKFVEIPLMVVAGLGFVMQNIYIVLTSMLLMGVQSCIYSPSKYGIIREVGGVKKIPFGTGAMEMITFVAVLLGTFVGGYLSDISNTKLQTLSIVVVIVAFALIGYFFSAIFKVNEKVVEHGDSSSEKSNTLEKSSINPIRYAIQWYKWSKSIPGLNFCVLGLSCFWFIASLLQMNLYIYCDKILGLGNTATGTLLALSAVGIGAGCYVAGVIQKKKVNIKLVAIGGLGMFIFMLPMIFLNLNTPSFAVLLFLMAFSAGVFKIPLNSFLQARVTGRELTHVIAYDNQMEFTAILIAAGVFKLIESNFGSIAVFGVICIIVAFITILLKIKIK